MAESKFQKHKKGAISHYTRELTSIFLDLTETKLKNRSKQLLYKLKNHKFLEADPKKIDEILQK